MFNTPVKSQRRAEIVSIKTPHEFRESIKELEKGNYTLADQRALILAQNRAKAMLNKKDLSDKERKEMTEISKIKIPKSNKILGEIGLVEEYTEKGEKPFMTI
jgi:hypothetical protein